MSKSFKVTFTDNSDWYYPIMADSKFCKDEEHVESVRIENNKLVGEIVDFCNRSDYKKHNVLLVGQSGSGKSSVINTVLKVLTGKYFPRAKAGAGNVTSNTLELKWYKNCAANRADFDNYCPGNDNSSYQREFKDILDKLPDLFDVAGMKNMNSPETREILGLLIGGFIRPDTNIALLEKEQKRKGVGWLQTKYRTAKDEYKISYVLFACSCTTSIPHELIRCVREVIEEVDQQTYRKKYDCDVFVLITKFDKLESEARTAKEDAKRPETLSGHVSGSLISMRETDNTGESTTLDKLQKLEEEIAEAFVMMGNFQESRLRWASYSDSIKPDNIYVDNNSLKLLKFLTTPLHTCQNVDTLTIRDWQDEAKSIIEDWLHEASINIEFILRRFFGQRDEPILFPALLAFFVVLSGIYLILNSTPHRN